MGLAKRGPDAAPTFHRARSARAARSFTGRSGGSDLVLPGGHRSAAVRVPRNRRLGGRGGRGGIAHRRGQFAHPLDAFRHPLDLRNHLRRAGRGHLGGRERDGRRRGLLRLEVARERAGAAAAGPTGRGGRGVSPAPSACRPTGRSSSARRRMAQARNPKPSSGRAQERSRSASSRATRRASLDAISADGSVIAGWSGSQAVAWLSGAAPVALGDLAGGGTASIAWGVSADGSTIVGRGSSASGNEAFRWTQAEGMVGLGDLSGERSDRSPSTPPPTAPGSSEPPPAARAPAPRSSGTSRSA